MFSFYILDGSDQVSSQEEDTSSHYSNSPRFTQLNSQSTGLNPEKLDICKEEEASCEWTESEARVNKLEILRGALLSIRHALYDTNGFNVQKTQRKNIIDVK